MGELSEIMDVELLQSFVKTHGHIFRTPEFDTKITMANFQVLH